MKKRIIVLILGALLMTNVNMIPLAAGNNNQIVSPYWVNTSSVNGYLTVDGNDGNISILVNGNANVTRITAKATLYYKNSSNRWVKTNTVWNYSVNSDLLAINEDFTASSGTTYKVVLEADVYANGYTETITREFT